ncbi:hemicentin-2-like [Hyalella azteca]|uniref:Hemicentin-2-like n=1 Tax=Hyalella azteca TaxID=294128 RepID=A0A8B7NET5_HYAAZ|nr:hemicentin-2-like [Hyalella azteca]
MSPLFLLFVISTASGDGTSKSSPQQYLTLKAAKSAGVKEEPAFEIVDLYPLNHYPKVVNNSVSNITGQIGSSVFLPCRTQHSLERQVSWVRRRDWHILTSGLTSYTKERRFSVHHPEGSTEWTLAVKYLKLDDAGTYECQISGGAGMVSQLSILTVVVPQAVIPGNGEYHVDTGSTISLTCFIEKSSVAPQYIFWYHNSRMINYDQERGGVVVHTETEPRVMSRLTIADARPSDSGNYTCDAENTEAASITVYITQGNNIAAIQPRDVNHSSPLQSSAGIIFVTAIFEHLFLTIFICRSFMNIPCLIPLPD